MWRAFIASTNVPLSGFSILHIDACLRINDRLTWLPWWYFTISCHVSFRHLHSLSSGEKSTWPMQYCRHFLSADFMQSVLTLSIWFCRSFWLLFGSASIRLMTCWILAVTLWMLSWYMSSLVYFVTDFLFSHLNFLPVGLTIVSSCSPKRTWFGMSITITLWSPIPDQNGRKQAPMKSMSGDINTPSIWFSPWWKVFGPFTPVRSRIASFSSNCLNILPVAQYWDLH